MTLYFQTKVKKIKIHKDKIHVNKYPTIQVPSLRSFINYNYLNVKIKDD